MQSRLLAASLKKKLHIQILSSTNKKNPCRFRQHSGGQANVTSEPGLKLRKIVTALALH